MKTRPPSRPRALRGAWRNSRRALASAFLMPAARTVAETPTIARAVEPAILRASDVSPAVAVMT